MPLRTARNSASASHPVFNLDTAAVVIALVLGALLHFNVIQHISW